MFVYCRTTGVIRVFSCGYKTARLLFYFDINVLNAIIDLPIFRLFIFSLIFFVKVFMFTLLQPNNFRKLLIKVKICIKPDLFKTFYVKTIFYSCPNVRNKALPLSIIKVINM